MAGHELLWPSLPAMVFAVQRALRITSSVASAAPSAPSTRKTQSVQVSGPRGQIAVIPVRADVRSVADQRKISNLDASDIGDGVKLSGWQHAD